MNLNLQKPIVFFDLETTGTNVTHDRIVELSYIKVMPDGTEEKAAMRVNPGMHIPEQATAVHRISDDDVKDKPSFKDIAPALLQTFEGCDLAGFNSNKFDVPMLMEEFRRAGMTFDIQNRRLVDVQTIFHKMEQRTLVAAYRFYCGKELEGAHSAMVDTEATYEVLKSQLDRYESLQNDIDYLARFSMQNRNIDLAGRFIYNDNDEPIFNFGKHKGKKVADVILREDTGYYDWMMRGDFAQNTKDVMMSLYLKYKKR